VLRKYNGIPTNTFPLFLKECEFRFNYGTPKQQLKTLKECAEISSYLLQPHIATMRRDTLENTPLGRVIFAPQGRSLASLWKVVFATLPGPLEGEDESSLPLDQALLEDSHATLANAEQPIVERLLVVAHATELGRAPTSLLDGIVSLLRQLDASVVEIDDGQM